jgi:hypothetical protein
MAVGPTQARHAEPRGHGGAQVPALARNCAAGAITAADVAPRVRASAPARDGR